MPVSQRGTIADYKLIKSRHFFPDKYILTQSTSFDQAIDDSFAQKLLLTGQGGPNMIEGDNTSTTYSGVLNLPILISNGPRQNSNDRVWVDGLDFLNHILGENCEDIDNGDTKIFLAGNNEYDASIVVKISITNAGNQDTSVNIEFLSNVENVFEFVDIDELLLNLSVNGLITELRAANSVDCKVGFQTPENQNDFRIMTASDLIIDFKTDNHVIYGSGIPRMVFVYTNWMIQGGFTVLDDLRNYVGLNDNYNLYNPSIQTYGTLVQRENANNSNAFSISFSDIDPNSEFKFSSDVVYPSVSRSIANGVLFSRIKLLPFNRNT